MAVTVRSSIFHGQLGMTLPVTKPASEAAPMHQQLASSRHFPKADQDSAIYIKPGVEPASSMSVAQSLLFEFDQVRGQHQWQLIALIATALLADR